MSNYYQDSNSEIENDSYDSEEGQNLGISTLDYEKIDLEQKERIENNKRKYEKEQISQNNKNNNKKIKITSKENTIDNKNEKEKLKEKEKEKEDEEDYLVSCPICLEHFSNKTMLNPCYHAFCYICINKWSKVSQNCPLCKQPFDFAVYHIKDEFNFDKVYFGEKEILNKKKKNYNRTSSNKDEIEYRREIYDKGLYAKQIDKYKVLNENQTSKFNRIIPWIERDIKAILRMDDIDIVKDYIIGVIKKYDLDSEKAGEEISLFLNNKTNHFIHELKCFINSPFNIKTYDTQHQYEKKSEHKIPIEVVKDYFLTQQKLKEKTATKDI
ncbi:hypothetical protein BCR32DRAFT_248566 [Anaeromyces robustus]|uniref:RING-type E3 ubiquitin transferase n=1 Tax=Anaeromyces robustus TaxID=1754192 RepID=A0A1Y1WT16_9FUNG|nr:hypothetical protein BCR32DRAFT_248566 [Anaeromyces robustus]|eukprot:ORX76673.1 hypothetical protein BCR32DRAFT_248566 [Anaeromyces robustus]